MKYNLTDIQTAKSRNGCSLYAKFWIVGVMIGEIYDKGDGSEPTFVLSKSIGAKILYNKFISEIETLPEMYIEQVDMEIKIDQYLFIDLLHDSIVTKTEFKLLAA